MKNFAKILMVAIESLLLALVILSPWAFGAVHAPFELWVTYGVASVLALGGLWYAVRGQACLFTQPAGGWVAVGLYTLFLIATFQYLPIGQGVVKVLSPAAAFERAQLFSQNREVVRTSEEPTQEPALPRFQSENRTTLSLNPGGSYHFSLRLLGLTALFTVVCAWCASERRSGRWGSFLWRLSIIAAVLGTALAVFSIGQYFGGPPKKLYWTYDVKSQGFGPFLNRNHYPFFANMTLGLAIGLLLSRFEKRDSWLDTLVNDVSALWIIGAIVFITAGIVICGSRGGFVAMVAALLVGAAARFQQGVRLPMLVGLGGLAGAVLLVLSWIGFDVLSSRLTTITDTEEIRESGRIYLWASALQAALRFPLCGSGGETFTFWESMYNQSAVWNSSIHQATRCDNEFFDLFCEYGLLAMLAAIVVAVTLLRHGFQAARHSGLAVGALIAMTAVIVHSCMDFGLRAPASAVLATIIAGALCSLNVQPQPKRRHRRRSHREHRHASSRHSTRPLPTETPEQEHAHDDERAASSSLSSPSESALPDSTGASQWRLTLGGLGVAMACILIAVFLVSEKRRLAASDWAYRQALRQVIDRNLDAAAQEFNRAIRLAPEDAKLRRDVAARLLDMSKVADNPAQRTALRSLAVQQAVVARDQCPLAFEPHLYLGQNHDLLAAGDSPIAYFQRAHRLHPSNCDIAYGLGSLLFEAGQYDQAWDAWRASLEFIPNHFGQILDRSSERLTAQEIIERVLPAKPMLIFRAAEHSERTGRESDSQLYLARAAELLESSEDAVNLEITARVYTQMKSTDKAIEAYKKAILLEPGQMAWRMELVKLLIQAERLDEAQREIRSLLVFEPDNVTVQAMKNRVEELLREAKRKKST